MFKDINMADTGFKSPTTNGTPATYDGSATEFTNAANAYADDASYATVTDNEVTYKYQSYGGFAFGVPSGATIKGVEVTLKSKTSLGSMLNDFVIHSNSSGNSANSGTAAGTTEATVTVGGPTDLLSLSWVASDFSDANFWIAARTGSNNNGRVYSLNHIQVKVYYTLSIGQFFNLLP